MEKILVTAGEIESIYDEMIARARMKRRVPQGFRGVPYLNNDPAFQSVLPVGVDGQTTCSVEKNRMRFFNEIERLINQRRYRFKAYHEIVKTSKNGKERRILVACLRDQVVFRWMLKRLKKAQLVIEQKRAMEQAVAGILSEIRGRGGYKVIRTDIRDFYPRVNTGLLLRMLRPVLEAKGENYLCQLLEQALFNNPSSDKFTGLPLGLSISPMLSEYYISLTGIDDMEGPLKVFRYADDVVVIADKDSEKEDVVGALQDRIKAWGLELAEEKTEEIPMGESFVFLGVTFGPDKTVKLGEDRIKAWEAMVWADIARDFESYRIASATMNSQMPPSRQIINDGWKEAKRGSRSRYWRWKARLEDMNTEVGISTGEEEG